MPTSHPDTHLTARSMLRHRPISTEQAAEHPPAGPIGRASRLQPHPPTATTTGRAALPTRQRPPQRHWLFVAGVTMTVMIVLLLLVQLAKQWVTTVYDDLHYGRPRVMQLDAFVGHEPGKTPSHFLAINLNSRVEIIEFPGGDASKARIYIGPMIIGEGADLTPVLLSFADRNGDHLPDMLVRFGNMEVVYLNEHGQFVPQ